MISKSQSDINTHMCVCARRCEGAGTCMYGWQLILAAWKYLLRLTKHVNDMCMCIGVARYRHNLVALEFENL